MAYRSPSSSFHKILILVFGVAFGLVALALGYQAMNTSGDIRSKAAEEQSIYKQWEFNKENNTEGWMGNKEYVVKAQKGHLVLPILNVTTLPLERNIQVNTKLPKGLKTVAFSIAVGPVIFITPTPTQTPTPPPPYVSISPTPPPKNGFGGYVQGAMDESDDAAFARTVGVCTMEVQQCSDGTYIGRGGSRCEFMPCPIRKPPEPIFTARVYYKLVNKTVFEKPIEFNGLANGQFKEYKITLPDPGDIVIERLRIVFVSGVKPRDTISTDWIRLLGPVVKPTLYPTPTPFPSPTPTACSTGVKGEAIQTSSVCTNGTASRIVYTCWDGFTGSYGVGGTTCYTVKELEIQASMVCSGRSSCSPIPTVQPSKYPTPSSTGGPQPSIYPTPTLTPTPTPNQQACIDNGGRCESLYAHCPDPDNQLPYYCGSGLRCIPADMACIPAAQ